MNIEKDLFWALFLAAGALAAIYGWTAGKSREIKENEFNKDLRRKLETAAQQAEAQLRERARELDARQKHIEELRGQFSESYIAGRKWLAKFIAEADKALDETFERHLRNKPRPAKLASERVKEANIEKRKWKEEAKFLQFQLESFKEYFPVLAEYEAVILDDLHELSVSPNNLSVLDDVDPVRKFISKDEYERLTPTEKHQRALDRYLAGKLSPVQIGRLYEQYIGSLYEKDGWDVEYHGILRGFEDLGRDLICSKDDKVHIVQAKCWASARVIHEKHIFQLFGTAKLYLIANERPGLFQKDITAKFVSTTKLSETALKIARHLGVEVEERPLLKTFPMIKCNINPQTQERIYHLPFDQQYNKTKITPRLGEFYALTVEQAEAKGFRRAFRHNRGQSQIVTPEAPQRFL